MCMCLCVYMHMCVFPWRSEENTGLLGVGVKGNCKLPGVGAGN